MKKFSFFGVFGFFCLLLAGLLSPRLATAFNYQGVLKENGIPVTGIRDMIFALYNLDNCAGGFQGGQNITDVSVNNGLFNVPVEINPTPSPYSGQRLWLGISVNGTQVSCQEILPVPYAMGLKPGAIVIGDLAGAMLRASNKHTSLGIGVLGVSEAQIGSGIGVVGASGSPEGTGVMASGGWLGTGAALKISDGGIRVSDAGIGTHTPVFIHKVNTAAGGNLCQGAAHATVIDNKIINGIPGAMLIVTPNYGPRNSGTAPAVGIPAVYYDALNECGKGAGRWVIYNLTGVAQNNQSLFNVMAVVP